MKPIQALLVDDEYLALKLLENYLEQVPDIEVLAAVKSSMKALEVLGSQPVDLLFLDVQMPALSGNNLLKTLRNPPVTIFTTAYAEFAPEAFDLDAVDYLLKPFSFERFLQAVNKAREQIRWRRRRPSDPPTPTSNHLTVKVDGKMLRLSYDDILFIEGLKEYVRFVCRSGRYVSLWSMKNLEAALPSERFVRVHKSFIVNAEKVCALEGNRLEIEGHKVPVSRQKREEVVHRLFGER